MLNELFIHCQLKKKNADEIMQKIERKLSDEIFCQVEKLFIQSLIPLLLNTIHVVHSEQVQCELDNGKHFRFYYELI